MDTQGNDVLAGLQRMAREAEERMRDPVYAAELERREAEKQAAFDEYRARIWRMRYDAAAPVRNAKLAWDAQVTPAVQAVLDWYTQGHKRHLVLRGGVGCGKTTAACVAVKMWCEPSDVRRREEMQYCAGMWNENDVKHSVSWLRPDQVVSAVLHDYDEKSPKLRSLVVIDDVGLESRADFTTALCELLDRSGHTLVITTNLVKKTMRERYDLRLLDRLNDTARAIDLPEKSMRRQDGGF